MKNKKKISASEQRTLWGSRVVIWDHDDRGAVSGHMDCYVLFFRG